MALFKFFCDESYDSDPHQDSERILHAAKEPYVPRTYVVGGFFSNEIVWGRSKDRGTGKISASEFRAFTLRISMPETMSMKDGARTAKSDMRSTCSASSNGKV